MDKLNSLFDGRSHNRLFLYSDVARFNYDIRCSKNNPYCPRCCIYGRGIHSSVFFFINSALTITVATLLTGFIGLLICWALYHGLLEGQRLVPLIISIGMYLLATDLWRLLFGPYPLQFKGALNYGSVEFGAFKLTVLQIEMLAIVASILILVWFLMNRTKIGLAIRATAQNMSITRAFGINVTIVITFTFLLSSILAGFAGVMAAVYYLKASPFMGDTVLTTGLAVIVLGGMGSLLGVVVAALIIAFSQSLFIAYFSQVLPTYAIGFIILIIILVFRPLGLFGKETQA